MTTTDADNNNNASVPLADAGEPSRFKFSDGAVIIRDGTAEDYPLLYDAFFTVYGGRDSWYGVGTPHRILRAKMEQLLCAPNWRCIVACPAHAQDEIMGVLVYCPPQSFNPRYTVGWITVKPPWQRQGVAKALLKHANILPQGKYVSRGRRAIQCVQCGSPGYRPTNLTEVDCAFVMPAAFEHAARYGLRLMFRPNIPDIALWNTILAKQGNK